jgi:2,3-bisphosphoglycerate-dependent phosphoglycerate mutase
MVAETSIYLIRHAHAVWRHDDSRSLSAAGMTAAGLVADRLASSPIVAIYTSPSRRSIQTVEPLARRLGLQAEPIADLRERELPPVPHPEFEALVRQAWTSPDKAPAGGERNEQAQTRGLAFLHTVVARHRGQQVVVGTHGNLLALIVNGLDPRLGYDFWRELSFPDVYRLTFQGSDFRSVERLWHAG